MRHLLFLICLFLPSVALAQASTVFKGRPSIKISEGATSRKPENLSRERAVSFECVVSRIGEEYYWASRENAQLDRVDGGGAFITFVARNGSGYIRIIKKDLKKAASLMGEAEEKFDYVEHLLQGLKSVTYYGAEQL